MKLRAIVMNLAAVFLSGMTAAFAQDAPVLHADGDDYAADSLFLSEPLLPAPVFRAPMLPSLLRPQMPATREEKAAYVNALVHSSVMKSVDGNLKYVPMVDIDAKTGWKPFGNPFAIPYGYVPMGNSSNPFIVALIPGWEPEPDKYSPEAIPQCIRLEYDFATGTYRQVMVDWDEYSRQMSGFPTNLQTQPVPSIAVTPVERAMR